MTGRLSIQGFSAPAFRELLPALLDIYQNAMCPPQDQLPGRREMMAQHAGHPGFWSVVATSAGTPVGFAYGFQGRPGQWWHDVVTRPLSGLDDPRRLWFADPFEIAEVHVHPGWQGSGIGRDLLLQLTAVRSERTAVLSTYAIESPARRLYRSCGFGEVLPGFYFPGSPHQPFAIMAAPLPLRERGSPVPGRSHGSRSTD